MQRDYHDMKKIFGINRLPESFKIEAVDYPWGVGMTDGPRPVLYKVKVAGSDYETLISGLQDKETTYGYSQAVMRFNRELEEYASDADFENPPLPQPPHFTQVTKTPEGYDRYSTIVADARTSSPVYLYITTEVPHDG